MTENTVDRKLRAILAADVKGYSKMMGEDEVGTYQTLTTNLESIRSIISEHKGRVFSSPGDAVMAEFASVVDAVQCAVELQEKIEAANVDVPEDRKMQFRIGVNLGDVIHDGEQVYGDGVNIAARIETLAEPGGVSISRTVYNHAHKKLEFGYEYQGEHQVKNIAEPVRVYKVLTAPEHAGQLIGEAKAPKRSSKKSSIAIFTVLALIVAAAIWQFYPRAPEVEPASVEKMALPLPDKPSIAVLPFTNMSGEKEQEYFCDGLSEGIINGLAKNDRLFVIARNSTFTYKNKYTKVKQIAEDLGVRYVLEGSIQKVGDKVRITAQLIDALSGYHLFSERYDRELKDILNLQDEITMKVLTAVQVKTTLGESALYSGKGTNNLDAYLKVMQARDYKSTLNKERVVKAIQLLEEAIALDPEYAHAYSILSTAHWDMYLLGASESPEESIRTAIELGEKAVAMDESNPNIHANLAFPYLGIKKYDKSISLAEKAVSLAPNSASGYFALGSALYMAGRHQEAILALEKCLRLSPVPGHSMVLAALATSYTYVGQFEEAITTYKKQLHVFGPDQRGPHLGMASAYARMNRLEEARAEAAEVMRIDPEFSVERYLKSRPYDQARKDRVAGFLRKAGLPDKPPLPLPDKPSIAVLAFDNLSGDPEQQYFSDGITDQIITSISKVPHISVIARQSSFAFRDKQLTVQQIAKELGVKYILEGSLQRSGERLRINVKLIDATSGHHVWAENYDRKLDDVFAVQDEICKAIMVALQAKLTEGEMAHINADTVSIRAYEKFLKAQELYYRKTKEDCRIAQHLLQETIALDPEYAASYVWLGWIYLDEIQFGITKTPSESTTKAEEMVQKAIAIRGLTAEENSLLSVIYLMKRDLDKAIAYAEKAVEESPNNAGVHHTLGVALRSNGQYDEAISSFKKALQLNPYKPPIARLSQLAFTYLYIKEYEKAISILNETLERNPDYLFANMGLIAAYWFTGSEDKARQVVKHVLKINPKFSLGYYEKLWVQKDKTLTERLFDAWRKAGLPE